MEIMEYKKASTDFLRIASNMLNSSYDEGNLHLIRLKRYIEENPIIASIVNEKIEGVEYEEKLIVEGDSWWYNLNIPIREEEHIKVIYDYLIEITQEPLDLRGIARRFHCSSNKYDDIIRNYLNKVFKPLINFITDELRKRVVVMEKEDNKGINISIGTNYGANNVVGQGNITSTNTVSLGMEKESISSLIKELTELLKQENMDEAEREGILDDLECLHEQVSSSEPKKIRIKKVYESIKGFALNIPKGLKYGTVILEGINKLLGQVENLLG
ncbi:MAG: hypothetical protein KID02_07165 [Clostridiales bacterium]|nr:hypothetical protein [Clostridiales bacterium]